jgi:hypothetical protein
VPKFGNELIACFSWRCTDDDRDTCCDPVATCNTLDAPPPPAPGRVHKVLAPEIFCKNVTCGPQDVETCFDLEGT